jgi:hypothetical protein
MNDPHLSPIQGLEARQWLMDHIEGQVGFDDTKAGLLFTADSILLATLVALTSAETPSLESMTSVATQWS